MNSIRKPPLLRIPLTQLVVLALICLVAIPMGVTLVYSLALGGIIHILPNVYFAAHAYRYRGARMMPQVLRAFSKGEVGKFFLTMAGFAGVFATVKPLNVIAVAVAYVVMLAVNLVMVFVVTSQYHTKSH